MTSTKPTALVLTSNEAWHLQFGERQLERLHRIAGLVEPVRSTTLDDPAVAEHLDAVEVLITSWGAPALDAGALERMPRLKAVIHCAGTVRPVVSAELWQRGIVVSTSADVNAEPVAEFTLAAIILAGKKAPFLAADARTHRDDWSYREGRGRLGNSGLVIGVIGFSRIGKRVIQLVSSILHEAVILVADPYADPDAVAAAGATLTCLDEMLPVVDILTIHAPQLPSTRHMIAEPQLRALPDHCTVINTARGSLVDTAALERECATGRLNAILDVTDPEPLPASSPLYDLPNVMLTPHVAGSLGAETRRMTDAALDELERFAAARPLLREVRESDMAHMA